MSTYLVAVVVGVFDHIEETTAAGAQPGMNTQGGRVVTEIY